MVVSSGLPSEKYPLLGIFEFDQAKALKQEGNNVIFLAVDLRSVRRWRRWGISKGTKDGVDYIIVNFPAGRVPLKLLCKVGTFCLRRIYKLAIKDFGIPDIIHAHFTEMGCIVSRLSGELGIPYVVTEHSSQINQYYIDESRRQCAIEAYGGANKVISVGSALAKKIKKHTGYESIVVPNIIDTNLFFQCKRKAHAGFHLVTTSNLITLKRTWQILQALAMIEPKVIDYRLTVIGDGPERESLIQWKETLNLGGRVSIVGYKSREEIAEIYETADVFIMLSSSETFGVAYLEAMASGIPVIATRCGGPEDFVNKENGILVDVDDIQQASKAIVELYSNLSAYTADNLRGFVKNKFSPSVIAKQLMEVYKEIVLL